MTQSNFPAAETAQIGSDAGMSTLLKLMPAAVYSCDADGRLTFQDRLCLKTGRPNVPLSTRQSAEKGRFR